MSNTECGIKSDESLEIWIDSQMKKIEDEKAALDARLKLRNQLFDRWLKVDGHEMPSRIATLPEWLIARAVKYRESGTLVGVSLEECAAPRPGDRLFFVADGRHLTGIVEEVAHWVEEHPHWVAISLDDDTVNDDGPVEKPSA